MCYRQAIQFRTEFFNVFNHAAGNFGVITSTKDPREGELALKLRI